MGRIAFALALVGAACGGGGEPARCVGRIVDPPPRVTLGPIETMP